MCCSSYVYNLLYFVICKDIVEGTSRGKQGVNLHVLRILPISWESKSVSLYDSLKADWAVLSSVCLLRLKFNIKYLNYLLGFGWLLPSSWAYFTFFLSLLHKHCFQHLYVNVRTLHSYFVHRLMANFMYLLQVVLISCVAVAAPCGAGRSCSVNPANQFAGEQGKTFCLYEYIKSGFFLYQCLARVEIMMGYLPVSIRWPKLCEKNQMLLQQPLTGTGLWHPISPSEQGWTKRNRKRNKCKCRCLSGISTSLCCAFIMN